MPFSAPFVAFGDEADQPTVMALHGIEKLGYIGPSSMGNLFFNMEYHSLGLVQGAHTENNDIILRSLMDSHLESPDAELLVLHLNNSAPISMPCALARSDSRIYVSPRKSERSRNPYTAFGREAYPLTFDRQDITLKHVLALFTPLGESPDERRFAIRMQYILDQLDEPFDFQLFNELIGREEWNGAEDGFIALRQTLVATLLSETMNQPDAEDFCRNTILDLTDPVLSRAHLDLVLMDIALRRFLIGTRRQKMIVFHYIDESLRPDSILLRSLEWLANSGKLRPATVIIATTDPTGISPTFNNSLDYVLCGTNRSSTSRRILEGEFAGLTLDEDVSHVEAVTLWSPTSFEFGDSVNLREFGKAWSQRCVSIAVNLIQHTKTPPTVKINLPIEPFISYTQTESSMTSLVPNIPPEDDLMAWVDHSRVKGLGISNASDEHKEQSVPQVVISLPREAEEAQNPQHSIVADTDRPLNNILTLLGELRQKKHKTTSNQILSTSSVSGTHMGEPSPHLRSTRLPDTANATPVVKHTLNHGSKYPDLLKAIQKAEKDHLGWVNYDAIGRLTGGNKAVQRLGFASYKSMMTDAYNDRVIEFKVGVGDPQFVRLVASQRGQNALQPSNPTDPSIQSVGGINAGRTMQPATSKQSGRDGTSRNQVSSRGNQHRKDE